MTESRHVDKVTGYIKSQSKEPHKKSSHEVNAMTVTISRQTGAGAITLATGLKEYLNAQLGRNERPWEVYDKNLIGRVLEEHGLPPTMEKYMAEDSPRQLKDAVGDMLGMHPPNWELVRDIGETIVKLARKGRCIIVGRGANIITRQFENVIHVRLIGSLEERIVRCRNQYEMAHNEAADFIKKEDRARRRYVLAYYDAEIDDPINYHAVINTDRFSPRELVRLISEIIST